MFIEMMTTNGGGAYRCRIVVNTDHILYSKYVTNDTYEFVMSNGNTLQVDIDDYKKAKAGLVGWHND